jgi:hypothetical protein
MSTTTTPPLQIVQGALAAQAHARMVAAVPATFRCDYEYPTPFEILHFDTDLRDAGVPIRRWILGDATDPLATAFCFRATWNTPRHVNDRDPPTCVFAKVCSARGPVTDLAVASDCAA